MLLIPDDRINHGDEVGERLARASACGQNVGLIALATINSLSLVLVERCRHSRGSGALAEPEDAGGNGREDALGG